MTCKDCIHYKACDDSYSLVNEKDIDKICLEFKDKSHFIELPCKIGDYIVWDNDGRLSLKQVLGFSYRKDGFGLRFILEDFDPIVTDPKIRAIIAEELK